MASKITRQSVALDIDIEKGSTFRHTLTWSAGDPAVPVDLTLATARMQIRADGSNPDFPDGTLLHEMTTENGGITLGDVTGEIELFISDADSTAFIWNFGLYDLEIIMSNSDVRRLTRGKIKAFDEETVTV